MSEIVGSDLSSLHSCLFTLQVAERGSWQVVGMTCKTCLLQSTIRTNISGYDTSVVRMRYDGRPDVMFSSVMCLSLRKVRIGEAHHVSSWGNPDGVIQIETRAMCH